MNILEINYSDTYFKKIKGKITLLFLFKKFVQSISYAARQVIKDLLFLNKNDNFNNKIVFFSSTINQRIAFSTLGANFSDVTYVGLSNESENRIPMGIGCITSILLLPVFCYDCIKYVNHRKRLLTFFNSYFFIRGMYFWWSFYLKFQKPKTIIMSNDHLVWHRVLRMAAQKNTIPVVYIQHASVTCKFPKLEFDLSLLEGRDALSKYEKKGINGKVELIGMIKYDKYHSYINKTKSISTIGFCTNLLDEEERIYKSVKKLHSEVNKKKLILRPHPRDDRYELYKKLKGELGIVLSNSKRENSFEYLQNVDVNIASETSIHLEAALLNVYPIYLKLKNEVYDHYGFINKGLLVDVFEDITELSKFVKILNEDRPYIRNRAKYYVETINTKYDGRSTDKVIISIDKIIK